MGHGHVHDRRELIPPHYLSQHASATKPEVAIYMMKTDQLSPTVLPA